MTTTRDRDRDDDEAPIGVDLEAWEAPPPAAGLADAVIARLREPQAAVARDTVVLDGARRRRRGWWLAGAAAVALAGTVVAMVAVVALRAPRPGAPVDGQGVAVADRPRHLALGPSSAELDPGAEVQWTRTGHRLTVVQARGAASWRIAAADTLVIDAGAAGASVEATGASLRVEVHMKPEIQYTEDRARTARTVATSAVTAAAVAMVTVVVYDGRVDVTHDGQTVRVEPGATFEVRPVAPAVDQLAVGGGAPDDATARIAELSAKVAALEAENRELAARAAARPVPSPVDEPRPASLTRDLISAAIATVKEPIRACGGDWSGTLKLRVEVAPDGSVRRVDATPDAPPARCVETVMRELRFAATTNGGSFSYPFLFAGSAEACDADALLARGSDLYMAGNHAAALAAFETAYRCRADGTVAVRATMAACAAKRVDAARVWWRRLAPAQQRTIVQICVRNGIGQDELASP